MAQEHAQDHCTDCQALCVLTKAWIVILSEQMSSEKSTAAAAAAAVVFLSFFVRLVSRGRWMQLRVTHGLYAHIK
jgi:hypothetical protein